MNDVKTGGRWTEAEKMDHIDVLKFRAILFALKSFVRLIEGKYVKILTDSTTAVSYVNNFGGIKSVKCNQLSQHIWQWCLDHDVWIISSHIPGVRNEADRPSRYFNDNIEWELDQTIFKEICGKFGTPSIDLFASRLNHKLPVYCSWRPDPNARFIDAFSLNWGDFDMCSIFPPFSLVGRCIHKVRNDMAQAVVVAPLWTTQIWWPVLMATLIDIPVILPQVKPILRLQHTSQQHPLAHKMVLIACKLSGKITETEAFQKTRILMASWRTSTKRQYQVYIRRWLQFCAKQKLIQFAFL